MSKTHWAERAWADTADALPVGTAPEQIPAYTGSHTSLRVGPDRSAEMFRMRAHPEHYPEWLRNQAEDHRARLVELVNRHTSAYDWDCSKCQHAVITPEITDRCPLCGS